MLRLKNKDILINYFKSNEKSLDNLNMGPEYEYFIVHRDTYETVSFYGEKGIEYIFKRLVDLGWEPVYEGDYILGASFEDLSVTTEPGGQFEFSNMYKGSLKELKETYVRFFEILLPILDELNYDIVAMGYHPVTKIEDIKLLPKSRYDSMFNYFQKHGTMSHNMMKGTCALQFSIDFTSEEDYIKKSVVANGLVNILYSIFENAYFFEGEETHHNIRARIWENTDPQRSGLSKNAFLDDSYGGYADYILNTPSIFGYVDGEMTYTGDTLIGELIDENSSKEEIEHLLTMVFPDVRTKKFIEVRMMDSVPYPYNFSAFALIKGLLYDDENLEKLYDTFKNLTREEVYRSRKSMYEIGEEATYMDKSLKDWKKEIVDMARSGLESEDAKYLDVLDELFKSYGSLYNKSKALYDGKDVKSAAAFNRITMEGLCSQ